MIGAKTLFAGVLVWQAYRAYATQNPADAASSTMIDIGATIKKMTSGTLKTSAAGQAAIQQREGVRYQVYADAAGYLTAGVGHKLTRADGALSQGDAVSNAQVQSWFAADIAHAENTVTYYVTASLTQNQFDALVSAAFNLGSALFRNSDGSDTRILQYLNAGQYDAAAAELLRWNHAGGMVLAGLTTRRMGEMQQFLA